VDNAHKQKKTYIETYKNLTANCDKDNQRKDIRWDRNIAQMFVNDVSDF